MKTFIYKAKNGPDKVIEGKMIAPSEEIVVARLSEKGYMATEIKAANHQQEEKHFTLRSLFGISSKDRILFTRQLGILLRSGVPMLKAIGTLSGQVKDKKFSAMLSEMSDKIRDGRSLSEALAEYPRIFSPFYAAMIKSGEDSGKLDRSLDRIADYYTKQGRMLAKVRSAMVYPLFVLVIGILTIVFVFTNVMPRIIPLLLNLNTKLPLPTKILIAGSDFINGNWMWILLGLVIFFLILKKAFSNKIFKNSFSNFKLTFPVIGSVIYKSELARFTRALEMSLASGIPIINALNVSLPILNEETIREKLGLGAKKIEVGEPLSKTFGATGVYPDFAINLIQVGEESGNLVDVLGEIASSFETDSEDGLGILIDLVEPVMILGIGLIVGFIVSAVLLPIFQLNVIQL